jgi:hypothetical protein
MQAAISTGAAPMSTGPGTSWDELPDQRCDGPEASSRSAVADRREIHLRGLLLAASWSLMPIILRLVLLLPLLAPGAETRHTDGPAKGGGITVAAPSANRGRRDNYHVQTGLPGYSYNVAARHIDPDQPAGICLFIPGQGARDESPWFDPWDAPVLQAHRLIGINMAWKDGDNTRDTAGKVDACRIAIGQVCADYKVVLGRGVLAAFSGGGVPQGLRW